MKAAAFDHVAPRSLGEALALLRAHGEDAKLLAGGQSLMPVLALRLAAPAMLVDLNHVAGLDTLHEESCGDLLTGAMLRTRTLELSGRIARAQPLLHAAAPWIAHVQIRNRGTVGGSLAHADPAAELPAVAIASGATLRIAGPTGEREQPAERFFTGLFGTTLAADEILAAVRWPAWPAGRRHGFVEIARRHGDYAIAGVALTVDLDPRQVITAARVVIFGATDTPLRAAAVEAALLGQPADPELAADAAALSGHGLDPRGDLQASAEYRRELAPVLVRRALVQAFVAAPLPPSPEVP
jgi:carbon-monoxide dehydrogenase medium subunit